MIKDEVVLHTVSKTEHKGGNENHSNKNSIFFSTVDGLDNLFEVEISAGKRIKISFEAWDKNSGSDDLETTWTDLEVPFSETGASSDWSMKSYTKNRGTDGKATFTFKYRVTSCDTFFTGSGCNSCVTNRYGADCRTYCKPQSGFYTCSSKGEKICEERRKGEDCSICYEQFTGETVKTVPKITTPRTLAQFTVLLHQIDISALIKDKNNVFKTEQDLIVKSASPIITEKIVLHFVKKQTTTLVINLEEKSVRNTFIRQESVTLTVNQYLATLLVTKPPDKRFV